MKLCVPFNLEIPAYEAVPRTFEALKVLLEKLESRFSPGHLAEGIVFHHSDGRRAKIKRKDFAYGAAPASRAVPGTPAHRSSRGKAS